MEGTTIKDRKALSTSYGVSTRGCSVCGWSIVKKDRQERSTKLAMRLHRKVGCTYNKSAVQDLCDSTYNMYQNLEKVSHVSLFNDNKLEHVGSAVMG